MFTTQDKKQIADYGIPPATVEDQIAKFKSGFPATVLEKPATTSDGILKLSEKEVSAHQVHYEQNLSSLTIVKFVPASGAASRMFKNLFSFMVKYSGSEADYEKLTADKGKGSMFAFFKQLEDFAFYTDLKAEFKSVSLEENLLKRNYVEVLKKLLNEDGLNYGNLPKGLLQFHKYGDKSRTPVEEHMVEGAQYAASSTREVAIHFTVSPEHQSRFEAHVARVKKIYEDLYKVKISISYSVQKPSTDTIAVAMDNTPFRNGDGSLLFRPAGHGALLDNLNDIHADIIFLKNIDNVVPDRLKGETITYKKVIAGVLLTYSEKIKEAYSSIKSGADLHPAEKLLAELGYSPSSQYYSLEKEAKTTFLLQKLNRPLRVCGMVKNDGDTGGGPFWVRGTDGSVTLQVVETAQINLNDAGQKAIFSKSTHFNPVDVVCSTKDVTGKKINLMNHRDLNAGFITQKSKDGKDLKAMELPGLWNGSMADWNTVFVEVPLITFNPVKSVTDLLEKEHQS